MAEKSNINHDSNNNDDPRKKRHLKRWLFTIFLPLGLIGKAVYSTWKALRDRDKKLLEAERELPTTAPYHRQRRVVQIGGGVPLTATVFVPSGEGPFPAMIMVHSWMFWRLQCDWLYAPSFARRGYVVLTYDCRGWGTSGGEVSCAAPDRELCDLEDMITWMTSPESGIPADPERIGITGVSYGGGHSFLAATRDPRIKAAAPMNGWTDLYASLVPNGCWKAVWSIALFIGSLWALKFNLKNDLVRWLKAVVLERNLTAVKGELEERSAIYNVDDVQCPMFIVHSWNDDLFEPNQILRFYERLKTPKRLYMANGLHGYDAGRGDLLVPNRIWDDARRFFDYWLKDEKDNGIGTEPPVKYYTPWNKEMAEAEDWPPPGVEDVTWYLRGEHPATINAGMLLPEPADKPEPAQTLINNTVSNLHTSGPSMLRLNVLDNLPIPGVPFSVPGDSMAFTSPVLDAPLEIVGAPNVNLHVTSSTKECQVNALLYDVGPRGFCRLVTHCAAMRTDMVPGRVEALNVELIACAHRFKPGHRVRLVLCAADPLYVFPSLVPSFYRVFHNPTYQSSMTLPVMEPARK
ncbi:MAG: CocE/NonD family hydrolase [Actinobacteria bacterium]|nr:CocE/NonD family hydrolase [Actinomycetota bacterium]MBU1943142.1 CocE/NonD family hydrolase [Actinomycetota bacterium]MBU2687911.1 CocE/NonD family hydrolase [Actinomycetota bacterium]